jgi:hypothetical protein
VNGRRFSANLERELTDDSHIIGVFSVFEMLQAALADRPASEKGWMLKADHGNAGLGNRRLRSLYLSEADRELAQRLLAEDEYLLLERWRPRILDIAATFDLGPGGEVLRSELHEIVNTADGAFIGALFDHDSDTIRPWRREMHETVAFVAERLAAAGYFGPVCIDAFVWNEAGGQRLRPLVDLNARMHVSAPILRLWRQWEGDRVLFWRFFSSRKLTLPDSYAEFEHALGDDVFDADSRRGVFLTSPMRLRQESRRLARFGVAFSGTHRTEIEEMEHRFRTRFEE